METIPLSVEEFKVIAKRIADALQREQDEGKAETGFVHRYMEATTDGLARKARAGEKYLAEIRKQPRH